ncbi:MAG: reverse transcriptase-like protein [Thermodesulfobacteriota bacterium]
MRSDSELVVHQLSGKYRVKNEGLKPLVQKVEILRSRFSGFSLSYIPREKNREADRLANLALDGKKTKALHAVGQIKILGSGTQDQMIFYPGVHG